jgi:hypothetical protein
MVFANLISISIGRTMERTSHINAFFVDLGRWLISVTILLLLVVPCLYKGQKHTQRFVEKVLISEHRKISDHDRNTEVARLLIHTTSEETRLQDEIMAGFEQAIISNIDFPESIVQARTNPVFDQGISLEKISLSITALAVTAPAYLYPGLGLIELPEGGSRVNVSPSLQEKHPENGREKATSLPHEEKEERNFDHIIQRVAKSYDVDPALVRAIIMAESSYNPRAVSKKGAKGLMQLMPKTAEYLGVEDSFNPEHNIDGGVRYFKELLDQFDGDVKLALAAYNAGSRKVREYKGIPPFKATQLYVKKVFEYQQQYKQ